MFCCLIFAQAIAEDTLPWVSSRWRGSASPLTGARGAFEWQLSNARALDFRLRMLSMVNLKDAARRGGSSLLIFTGRQMVCVAPVSAQLYTQTSVPSSTIASQPTSKSESCATVTSRTGSTCGFPFSSIGRGNPSAQRPMVGKGGWRARARARTATAPRSHPVQ